MKNLMRLLKWILKAAIFFALFVFALNNRQDATVHLFFDIEWRAPLVLIVLAAFALGLVSGVLAMVPRWLKQRKAANRARRQTVVGDSQQFPSTLSAHEP